MTEPRVTISRTVVFPKSGANKLRASSNHKSHHSGRFKIHYSLTSTSVEQLQFAVLQLGDSGNPLTVNRHRAVSLV